MPRSVLPGAIAFIATVASGGTAAVAFKAFVVTTALTAVSRALTRKPRNANPVISQSGGGPISIRQPIAPWQVVFGRARVGGVLTFRYISPDRKYFHMVITVACHEIDAFEEVWFNDEKLTLDAAGNVFGNYAKAVQVKQEHHAFVPGSPHQVTLTGLVAVEGIKMQYIGELFMQQVEPGQIQNSFQFSVTGETITFHAGAQGRFVRIFYFTAALSGGSWARVKFSKGDEGPGVQPFPDLVAESAGAWTQEHKQYGHAKLYVRLEGNHDIFPAGVPQITAVVRGAKLYDPRDGTAVYKANAALAINHYLTNAEYGLGASQASEIHADDLESAANSCDDAVTIAAGGTEPRYSVNGAFLTSETPKTVLERLLAACAGSLVALGDRWHINVGVYHVPTVTLGLAERAGPDTVAPMPSSRDDGNANMIKGVYTNRFGQWQPDDFPPVRSATYLAQDGNEERPKDIDLTAFVTSASQAQRLAKIDLLRLRQGLTIAAPFKLPAWQVVPGRTVNLVDADMGWNPKAFEIEAAQLALAPDGDALTLQVELEMRETAAAIYDWSSSEEGEPDYAPNTQLPAPAPAAPGAPMIKEALVTTRSSRGLAVLVTMSWTASPSAFALHYQPEYQPAGGSSWTVLPLQTGTSVELADFAPGRYDFRVKAIDPAIGASSGYSTSANVEIVGGTEIPEDLTGLSLQAAGGMAVLRWDLHPALDVREGGGILFRHSAQTDPALAIWEESFSIGERIAGNANQAALALKPGTYLARPIDSGGRLSAAPTKISTKQASVHAFVNTDTVTEDPGFSGTHDGTVATDGILKLAGAGLFDAIPSLDALATPLDSYGGVDAGGGTYTFAAGLDLGAVQNVRLTSQLEGFVANVNDLVDSRTAAIDDWDDFDGTAGASADAYVEARDTDDDPAGSPSWRAWKRLDAAEFAARGFQFRAQLSTQDASYNVVVSALRVVAAQVY